MFIKEMDWLVLMISYRNKTHAFESNIPTQETDLNVIFIVLSILKMKIIL